MAVLIPHISTEISAVLSICVLCSLVVVPFHVALLTAAFIREMPPFLGLFPSANCRLAASLQAFKNSKSTDARWYRLSYYA